MDREGNKFVKVYARKTKSIIVARLICKKIATYTGIKFKEEKTQIGYDECVDFIFNL